MPQLRQPFLHDLVTTVAAPTQVLSGRSGDIEGHGAQGVLHADVRVVSELRVTVDGRPAVHIATITDRSGPTFSGVLRHVGGDLAAGEDPQVRLDRHRRVAPGTVVEALTVVSVLDAPVPLTLRVALRSDLAPMERIRSGEHPTAADLRAVVDGDQARWTAGDLSVDLAAPGAEVSCVDDDLVVSWNLVVPARGQVAVAWTLQVQDRGGVVVAAGGAGLAVPAIVAESSRSLAEAGVVEPRLVPWLQQSLTDLNGLRMATADAPGESFFAAGCPWYLTLFGRDSLWTSRLLLSVDVNQAEGTLRTLARLAGTRSDPESGEAPGKIPHELRRGQFTFGTSSLPPLYYGTIDATPLWICLLHDAWRLGLDARVVTSLLPTLEAALAWLVNYGDEDGDGFLEYLDTSGHGLANQGWKDSADSVRFADGTIAEGPVALCEVQGYAYEAAVSGAALLDAFGLDGGGLYRAWAAELATRFRASFWCGEGEGRYPALALDGRKQRVDSVTSNIGHLLGTGILLPEEERLVARRVTAPDLDSGLGLRTMSSADGGYSPLSYHCGSVWPHDTAVVIAGLVRAGFSALAGGLVEGLLRASVAFDQRLPELWSGEGRPVPYPAACRPQAWSAAAAATVADALQAGAGG
jgi:glycogen debranching enzyme